MVVISWNCAATGWRTTSYLHMMVTLPLKQVLDQPPMGTIGGHYMGTAKGVLGYEVITTYERVLPPLP
jgi:hypothetical protein